jgi:predicted signal transduction protein with EAL and GGDEF domain
MDTVARIGGDEFVVLAPDVDGHLNAVDLSTRLMASLCQRSDRSEDGDPVAASVGIAVSAAGSTAETLLNEADTAMYQAKTLGGGRAEVFDPALRLQIRQRTMAQQMLQSALDDRRIIVHYQPIVDLSTGIISRFEALARIVERDASVLAPAAFISVAEDTGLIVPLGAQVLGIACEEARRWQPAGATGSSLAVTVNLSSRQFEPGDLAAFVRERLDHSGLDPTCLHLELTETAVIDPRPEVLKQLEELRALGVQIGLDDFGTGYASLTHLRSLPLTFVKIDRTFVEGVGTENEDEGIVSAVIDLAANLGLRSIAEGVETKDQLDRLRELGCDEAQGYFFARPVPPEGLPELLEHPGW